MATPRRMAETIQVEAPQVQLACRSFAGNRSQSFLIVVLRERRRRWRISPRGQRRERGGSGVMEEAAMPRQRWLGRWSLTPTPHRGLGTNDVCAERGNPKSKKSGKAVWI